MDTLLMQSLYLGYTMIDRYKHLDAAGIQQEYSSLIRETRMQNDPATANEMIKRGNKKVKCRLFFM